MTMKAAVVPELAAPLEIRNVPVPEPGPGQVRIRQKAAAVHFADIMMRKGAYFLLPDLPSPVGLDGAGIVDAIGPGVDNVKVGDRVSQGEALLAVTPAGGGEEEE